jgi:hypothetical protein
MKLKCLLAAALLLALAPGMTGQTSRFNVPFTFVGFDSDFPAGDYEMVLVPGSTFARLYNSQTGQSRVRAPHAEPGLPRSIAAAN